MFVQVGLIKTSLTVTMALHDFQSKYKDAPVVIVSICSESTVIGATLSQMQGLLLGRQDLAGVWRARTDLAMALDTAITGCMVVYSCLDIEVKRIISTGSGPGDTRWKSRLRVMWNEKKLQELLTALRGQQTAISLLIQLLQT